LPDPSHPTALCIIGSCDQKLWGLTPAERLKRQFAQAGVADVVSLAEAARHGGPVVLVRAEAVLDQPVVAVLSRRTGLLLIGDGPRGRRPVAANVRACRAEEAARLLETGDAKGAGRDLEVRAPGELDAAFWKGLRKRQTPYALLLDAANREAVEWRMFMGTYKGATDFVTKHLWPRPAFIVTRFLAPLGITPNMVTLAGAVLMAAAFWLFLEGAYVSGLIAAWLMTFLDTVDGKLARATLTSSKWGDVLDHGMDLVHPPFWYVAWGLGLEAAGRALPGAVLWTAIGVILAGYILQRAMEGIAIKWLGLEIHIWRPIDTWFRQITARRNPNLALLTAATMVGRPDWGLVAVAAWTAICLVLHGIQLLQAFAVRRQTGPLTSWLEAPAGLP
jgi:phosphatidylglycerophosphate synthase